MTCRLWGNSIQWLFSSAAIVEPKQMANKCKKTQQKSTTALITYLLVYSSFLQTDFVILPQNSGENWCLVCTQVFVHVMKWDWHIDTPCLSKKRRLFLLPRSGFQQHFCFEMYSKYHKTIIKVFHDSYFVFQVIWKYMVVLCE